MRKKDKVKLNRVGSYVTRTISIDKGILEAAGVDPDRELFAVRKANKDSKQIILELEEK